MKEFIEFCLKSFAAIAGIIIIFWVYSKLVSNPIRLHMSAIGP
jgi:hypothetical protein